MSQHDCASRLDASANKYEYTLVPGAIVGALYGHAAVEYKAPGGLGKGDPIERVYEGGKIDAKKASSR